jgi:hypothetical protein
MGALNAVWATCPHKQPGFRRGAHPHATPRPEAPSSQSHAVLSRTIANISLHGWPRHFILSLSAEGEVWGLWGPWGCVLTRDNPVCARMPSSTSSDGFNGPPSPAVQGGEGPEGRDCMVRLFLEE